MKFLTAHDIENARRIQADMMTSHVVVKRPVTSEGSYGDISLDGYTTVYQGRARISPVILNAGMGIGQGVVDTTGRYDAVLPAGADIEVEDVVDERSGRTFSVVAVHRASGEIATGIRASLEERP